MKHQKNLAKLLQYQEYFPKFRQYKRTTIKSVLYRFIKTIANEGPLTWKEVQQKVWRHTANGSPIMNHTYGIDTKNRIEYMLNIYRNPSDKRIFMYEVNEIGKAFIYYLECVKQTVSSRNK